MSSMAGSMQQRNGGQIQAGNIVQACKKAPMTIASGGPSREALCAPADVLCQDQAVLADAGRGHPGEGLHNAGEGQPALVLHGPWREQQQVLLLCSAFRH